MREAFRKDHPGVTLDRADRLIAPNGDVHYEFKFTDTKGRKAEAEYDDKGKPAHP